MEKEVIHIPNWVVDYDDPFEFKAWNISFDSSNLITLPIRSLQYFDQSKYPETMMACTIVNAFRQRCHRVGKTFTDDEMLAVVKYAVTQWYQIGTWWWTSQAMNAVNKYVALNNTEHKTAFISLQYNDPEIAKIMAKNHALGITYRANAVWDKDRRDWVLEGKEYKPMTYWHRTCMRLIKGTDIDDSFSIQHYNIKYFSDLVASTNIYPTVYLWLVDTNLDTENVKKFTKWKIMLEQNISNNNVMLDDPRRGTTDRTFRELLTKDNNLLKIKLDYVTKELKQNGL